jgi:pentapeptide repeat protein
MARLNGVCAAALWLALAVPAAPAAGATPQPTTVRGEAIVRALRAGEPVVRDGTRVIGPVDLTAVQTVRGVFKCRDCAFAGAVKAPDVTFEKTVDLSGASFTRNVDFRGATFAAPALFQTSLADRTRGFGEKRVVFAQRADFSLALFSDLSSFSGAVFGNDAVFRDARFSDVTFASANFSDDAALERATFRGAAVFNNVTFGGAANFSDSDFRKRADFSLARFDGGGVFTRAQFGEDASFLGGTMTAPSRSAEAARFDDVAATGNLNFTFVEFNVASDRGRYEAALAVFSDLVCGGSLVFRNATFAKDRVLEMERLQARDLVLDVDTVKLINGEDDQRAVLQMIENSGKARGDLAAANDAHYALRADRSKDYSTVGRALDYVFYRGVAGYFVRPMRPLVVLVVVVALFSLVSVIRAYRRREPGSAAAVPVSRRRRAWSSTTGRCSDFLTCFLDKLGLVRPQRTDGDSPPLGRRLESFAYRLLVVCAILGLANSNPTLRQMVQTLF